MGRREPENVSLKIFKREGTCFKYLSNGMRLDRQTRGREGEDDVQMTSRNISLLHLRGTKLRITPLHFTTPQNNSEG